VGQLEVEPSAPTTYALHAIGHFGQLVISEIRVDVVKPEILEFTWEVNLAHGIDNVDLAWKTCGAATVEVEGVQSGLPSEGVLHVKIRKLTRFKLRVKGLFGDVVAELEAHPFPVPIIEQMKLDYPALAMNTVVNIPSISLPFVDLDKTMLKESAPKEALDPGYLRDHMEVAWRELHDKRTHWLLSGKAIWEKVTGTKP